MRRRVLGNPGASAEHLYRPCVERPSDLDNKAGSVSAMNKLKTQNFKNGRNAYQWPYARRFHA